MLTINVVHRFEGQSDKDRPTDLKLDQLAVSLNQLKELLAMTEAEMLAKLQAVSALQTKTITEIADLKNKSAALQEAVTALQEALANAGTPSQAVQDAVSEVLSKAVAVDEAIPDIPAP